MSDQTPSTNPPRQDPAPFRVMCGSCKKLRDEDIVGFYNGCNICYRCAELLTPAWYNSDRMEILEAAEQCGRTLIGTEFSLRDPDRLVLVEDDLGDVVLGPTKRADLLTEIALPKCATTDFLPESIRITHRQMHREAVNSSTAMEYNFENGHVQWVGECFPFSAGDEAFTLTVFSRRN